MSRKDSPFLGVCAVLFNQKGQVLLGKRKNSYKAGYYGLPGGRVEVNELAADAINREVLEETGLKMNHLQYLGVVRENQGDYDFIHFVYVAENITQEPKLCEPEKCEGWQWVERDSLDGSILPGHLAAIQLYTSNEKFVDSIQVDRAR